MIWAPNVEQADRTTIEQKQLTGLQDTVKRVYDNVPYYRSKLDELGIKPEDTSSFPMCKSCRLLSKTTCVRIIRSVCWQCR